MKPILCFVDNDEVYLFLIRKMIEKKYMTDKLLEFYNGLEAIEFIKENIEDTHLLPDIIFLDINMPVMDGWEFIESFKRVKHEIHKPITIYMVSSSVDETDMDRAKNIEEISDFVCKPMTMEKVNSIFQVAEKAS
jgi:CheY-like chemotaxis protein